jgi:hypothetical protein
MTQPCGFWCQLIWQRYYYYYYYYYSKGPGNGAFLFSEVRNRAKVRTGDRHPNRLHRLPPGQKGAGFEPATSGL